MFAGKILVKWFVLFDDQRDCFIEEINEVRKGIAEESADAQRHIDPRPAKLCERQNLDPLQPPRLRIPNWLNPEQREGLSNVVSVGAHLGGSPDTQAHHLRVRTFFFAEALDGLSREL